MQEARTRLAVVLEDATSSDEQITAHAEQLIAAHDDLERRIAKHLLAIRGLLTPEQAKQLMGLAASSVLSACPSGQHPPGASEEAPGGP